MGRDRLARAGRPGAPGYVRKKNLGSIPPEYQWQFQTKLELAVALMGWLVTWLGHKGKPIWLVMDGAYAAQVVLRGAKKLGVIVVSRLRLDAALWTLPATHQPKGKRGPKPKYGDQRISLAKRAAAKGGWTTAEVEIYGRFEEVTYKTFLATWPPAGGVIRVVLVKNPDSIGTGWHSFAPMRTRRRRTSWVWCRIGRRSNPGAPGFHDVKEIWGAGQQQLRNVHANVGAWHLNLWAYTLVELWAWHRSEEELVDRSASPWDSESRRAGIARRPSKGNVA